MKKLIKKLKYFWKHVDRIPMTCDGEDVYYCETIRFCLFSSSYFFEPRK